MGRVTASLGVAEYPQDAKDLKELIARADHALYHCKESGRNRVTGFEPALLQDGPAESEKVDKIPPTPTSPPA